MCCISDKIWRKYISTNRKKKSDKMWVDSQQVNNKDKDK